MTNAEPKQAAEEMEQKFNKFLQRTASELPAATRQLLAQDMVQAIQDWAAAPPEHRKQQMRKSEKKMEARLGIKSGFNLRISFSKKKATKEIASDRAHLYLTHFTDSIQRLRTRRHIEQQQLTFRIDNIDVNHPHLFQVNAVLTGADLRLREVRSAKGGTNRRKSGKPAEVQISGFLFEESA